MTRKAFLKQYGLRFAVSFALLGLLVYTVYHALGGSAAGLQTAYTQKITQNEILGGKAYLFRDEAVLWSESRGVVNALVESGSKVSKDVPVSEVWNGYAADSVGLSQLELDQLNRLIAVLEDSLVSADTTLSKAELYCKAAEADYLALRRAVESGRWSNVQALEDSMLSMLNRYRTLIGEEEEIPDALTRLRAERTALLKGSCQRFLNTRSSGYYYDRTHVDGYEDLFTPETLKELSGETLARLKETEVTPIGTRTVAGKMVYGNRWYLVIEIGESVGKHLAPDRSYRICFPENEDRELTLTCERILETDGLAVLYSDEIPRDFVFLRAQSVEITVGTVDGYYVPDSAIYSLDGAVGVFVFEDSATRFRRIEVLYRGDGFVIAAEQGTLGKDYLALNDLMVTAGSGLYDGRVYR